MNEMVSPAPDLKELFKYSAVYWRQRAKEIFGVADDIGKHLSARLTEAERETLTRRREALGNAVQELTRRAASPELILATTGTTSSGKSTLANFLIGEDILPSAVQEMSAGLVTVRHHENRHTLSIPSTRGATWETGEWDDLSAGDLRHRLEKTMEAFRAVRKEDASIEAVQFKIDWPIRLAAEKARFGLPDGTRVTILDLPGLKAINDERNGPLIQENISQALCLVAYNAEETDDMKQKELLNQVVAQVMELRKSSKSLGRMLFLLNRVDAFARNDDPEASFEEFRAYVTDQLHDGLAEALPEDRTPIESIAPAAISSLPALWAVEASLPRSSPERRQELLEKIEKHFSPIFPKDYWKTYPRDFNDLTDDLRRHLVDDTLHYARAYEFEQRLGDHIAANLPEIVLAGPIGAASKATDEFLMELDKIIEAYSTRTIDEAGIAKNHLKIIHDGLQREVDEVKNLIERLRIGSKYGTDSYEDVLGDIDFIEKKINISLDPIKNYFRDIFIKPFSDLSDYCESAMREEPIPPSSLMGGAKTLPQFNEALAGLRHSPYGRLWERGGKFQECSDVEQVKRALETFAVQLSDITNFMVNRAENHSGDRIRIVFKECASLLIAQIEQKGNEALEQELRAFPGLKTIFRHGEIAFPSFKGIEIKFSPHIGEWCRVERREEEKISHEKRWYSLWLFNHEVKESVIKKYEVNGIDVAGFGDVIAGFSKSSEAKLLHDRVNEYLSSLVDIFCTHINGRIDAGRDGYIRAIDQSVHEIDQRQEQVREALERDKETLGRLLMDSADSLEWEKTASLGSRIPA